MRRIERDKLSGDELIGHQRTVWWKNTENKNIENYSNVNANV